jgi:subtilisin family serine protease
MTAAVPSQPPIRRPVVSPLLTSASGVDDTTRDRLVFSVGDRYAVLVELNLTPAVSADHIRGQFLDVFHAAFASEPQQPPEPRRISVHYLQCLLTASEIRALAEQDKQSRTIYRIWPDYRVRAHLDRSVSTIKADAAARTYATSGDGIVWAVIDSGIGQSHPHFACGTVTDPAVSRLHRDFTGLLTPGGTVTSDPAPALTDPSGHGTHVAGIIAGAAPADLARILIAVNEPSSTDLPSWVSRTLEPRAHAERDRAAGPAGQPQGA